MQISAIEKHDSGIHVGIHDLEGRASIHLVNAHLSYFGVQPSNLFRQHKDAKKYLSYLGRKIAYDQGKYSKKVVTFDVSTCTLSFTLRKEEMKIAMQRIAERSMAMTKQKYKILTLTKLCYSVVETAELLGQSESTIRRLIDRGEIGVIYPTSEMRITAKAIVQYLETIEAKAVIARRQQRCSRKKVMR